MLHSLKGRRTGGMRAHVMSCAGTYRATTTRQPWDSFLGYLCRIEAGLRALIIAHVRCAGFDRIAGDSR